MEIRYRWERNHYYMLISADCVAADSYQLRMLEENQIYGLLKVRAQQINGQTELCYHITGRQLTGQRFGGVYLTESYIKRLMAEINKTASALEEYLLDTDFLLLDPSYLYRETQSGNYLFVWFPYRTGETERSFQTLTEYFLPRIDHKDKEAVALGYGVYKEATEENIHPAVLKRLLWEAEPQENSKNAGLQEENSKFSNAEDSEKEMQEKERQRILDEFYSEEEETPVSYGVWGGIAGVALLCILVFLFWHFRLFSLFQLVLFLLILLFLSVAGSLFYIFMIRKRKDSSPANSQKNTRFSDPGNDYVNSDPSIPVSCKPEKKEQNISESLTVLLQEPDFSFPLLTGVGKNAGKIFTLEKEQTLIGKWAASADIFLDVPTVSRIHARILQEGDKYYAVDLNSRNGTLINGVPLDPEEKYLLKNNDIISFAKEDFRYTFPDSRPLNTDSEN